MKAYSIVKYITLILVSMFTMDLIHEIGHALFGIILGGNLEYMKVAFFRIYPDFAVEEDFIVGYVIVSGLHGFSMGLFLFGGSFSTLLASTFIYFLPLRGERLKNGIIKFLKVSGIVGSLDMLFYVTLPYLGLRHWVIVGGNIPEPIFGLEMMGIRSFVSIPILLTYSLYILFLYIKN